MTESLIRAWIPPAVEEQTEVRERYGGEWLNAALYPHYGCMRRTKISAFFSDIWLEGGDMRISRGTGEYVR